MGMTGPVLLCHLNIELYLAYYLDHHFIARLVFKCSENWTQNLCPAFE